MDNRYVKEFSRTLDDTIYSVVWFEKDPDEYDFDEIQYIAKAKEFRTAAEAQEFEKQKEMERKK